MSHLLNNPIRVAWALIHDGLRILNIVQLVLFKRSPLNRLSYDAHRIGSFPVAEFVRALREMVMDSNSARERDLYKYYQPWLDVQALQNVPVDQMAPEEPAPTSHKAQSSHDKALTAFAQLAALRLNVKRAMVSLIDSTQQIILAEATQSLSLVDDRRHAPDDHIWLGNVSIPAGDAVCQNVFGSTYTIQGQDGKDVEAEALVVPEMLEDDRFRDRPYVTAEKGVRFYAGVPIITRAGNKIGVYAVSNDHPRPPLTLDELNFMQDVALTIFEHLEMVKSRNDRDRGERMVKGLASFIDDLSSMKHQPEYPTDDPDSINGSVVGLERSEEHSSPPSSQPHMADYKSTSTDTFESSSTFQKEDRSASIDADGVKHTETSSPVSDINQVFARACQTIRRSTRADGCVFFDASSGSFGDDVVQANNGKAGVADLTQTSSSDSDRPLMHSRRRRRIDSASTGSDHGRNGTHPIPDVSENGGAAAHILGLSLKVSQSHELQGSGFPESELKTCLQRYPYGKIFHFDIGGSISSGDESLSDEMIVGGDRTEGSSRRPHVKRKKKRRSKFLPKNLFRLLPGVRSVVFLPLFDYSQNRWFAGGFLWTNQAGRLCNPEDEMPCLKAFGSCIMSEVASMEALNTNRAKTTFIASISHELRSPLHGILGSLEFLEDTMTTAYQMGLVSSIETCGKTLLDTIDHLLDYAKINNLNKVVSRRSSHTSLKSTKRGSADISGAMSSLVSDLDLASLVEDVLEAVFAGQTFRKERPRGARGGDGSVRGAIGQMHSLALDDNVSTEEAIRRGTDKFSGKVIIVLNIAKAASWWVRSQPGGLRRVIMNVFGNALKYCESGAIEAILTAKQVGKSAMSVDFLLKDTGRGMSKEFMANHLFRPFAQEDSFVYGTGLGLSIVKQIVDNLGGKVDVKSQQNVGTEVKISLSLPLVGTHPTVADDEILQAAYQMTKGKTICLLNPFGPIMKDKESQIQISKLTDSVATTCQEWFGMNFVEGKSMDEDADIFFYAEPPPIEYLLAHHSQRREAGKTGKEVALLITCTNAFEAASLRSSGLQHLISLGRIIEVISQPCGPRKLGKVLLQSLRRVEGLDHPLSTNRPQSSERNEQGFSTPGVQQRAAETEWTSSTTVYDPNIKQYRPSIETSKWKSDPPAGGPGPAPGEEAAALEWGKVKAGDISSNDVSLSSAITPASGTSDDNPPSESIANQPRVQPHVLLVDDNPINLKLLVTFMKKINHPFEEAVNGLDAFDRFKSSSRPFDYVLMDISMPVMDGLTSTRKIREYERETKSKPATIIALTGLASSSVQEEAFGAGISHFLAKPVRFKALQQLLESK